MAALVVLTALAVFSATAPALAQPQLVEKVARVEVSVYEDNLDDAKSRAVRQGQLNALRGAVRDLLAEEWVTLFDKELRQRILGRIDRYVSSYRVQRQETSVDRTRYRVSLSAQINRLQLTEDLHELGLPVLGDPPTPLAVLFDGNDPVLGDAALRRVVEDRLRARLTLLNFQVTALDRINSAAAGAFATPLGRAAERVALLASQQSAAALYIAFQSGAPAATDAGAAGARGQAWLYQRSTGELLASFEQQTRAAELRVPPRTSKERDAVLARLVDPLVIQMQPGAIQAARAANGDDSALRLRVLGFTSVEDQELFERAFFKRNSEFERFSLYAFDPSSVTYEGAYGGDRKRLEAQLRGRRIGEFSIQRVYWYNDVLELDVARLSRPALPEMRLFPREVRPPEVAAIVDDYLTRFSQLEIEDPVFTEVEDNGWLSRANPLPFNATVYALIDSRSDSDVYVGEALTAGEKLELIWHRVGRSNLTPAIRIYDEEGVLVSTFTPRTWLRYEYTVPKGQHRFYVEVGDRFGHLKVDTGGYLRFHYLFKINRGGP